MKRFNQNVNTGSKFSSSKITEEKWGFKKHLFCDILPNVVMIRIMLSALFYTVQNLYFFISVFQLVT